MAEYLPFIIAGLTAGSVYALAGIGLVLTYKTSGVFNFAHGALATVAAYVFYELYVLGGVSWPVAAAIAVLVAGPVMGVLLELIARRISGSALAHQVAATVGLLLVIQAATELQYESTVVRVVPTFLSTETFVIADTTVRVADATVIGISVAVTLALAAFFKFSRRGLTMRAVVDNPELLSLYGVSPFATRRMSWVLGAVLVSASGVLFAPLLPLNPLQLTLLVAAAFGAAAIGAFSSLSLTLFGGLAIGVLAALSTKWFTSGLLAGLPVALPFLVLFAVILVFPRGRLVGRATEPRRSAAAWSVPGLIQGVVGLLVLAGLWFVPSFAGVRLTSWTLAVAGIVVFLSLSLLVRTSGQVSLAHVSFTAIGAVTLSHLTVDKGMPWVIALGLAGLVAVPVGALLAVPAIRLTGLYLALSTFGFGILLQGMFYTQDYMFGSTGDALVEPRPDWGFLDVSSDSGFYRLVLVVAALTVLVVVLLNRSRMGRLMRGLAESPTAVATAGAEVNVTRVFAFCLSAFLASIGGALLAVAQTSVSGTAYQPLTSLVWFALIIVVGGGPWGAVVASAAFFLGPAYVDSPQITHVNQLLFGAAAVLVAVLPASARSVPSSVRRLLDRLGRRGPSELPPATSVERAPVAPTALEVRDLEIRFGGIRAVKGISISAATGAVTGLIGPNGAGKTTTFNACSGLVRPESGSVSIGGSSVTRRGPAFRARRGIGRTFQRMELFDSLTVRENVAMGAEGASAGLNPLSHLWSSPAQGRVVRDRTAEALRLCGLVELADRQAGSLSTGQRRLVELARCLAGEFAILLLDEPSSGLDQEETRHFGRILRRAVAERGVGILLVEHDMPLVMDICDYIYVLDFGDLIFEGTPTEVSRSSVVRAAYLGDAEGLDEGLDEAAELEVMA
ncbi:ATP-binding cassette domain-containing protein [Nocardioides immobilis]|uniref:ATP-binding cassette domain-containing protein n=1 Tax=Nocardioides immobilis TaxID=2049295 RepID=A0A417Y6B5_9ACTN|nr:branched-chain amino acid ABC transporter permease/ATP-binding protein [Nocardioides immobilis]RHW28117.1 ATP-binding cassette domain-containing protein [Nocardioides immobilis]